MSHPQQNQKKIKFMQMSKWIIIILCVLIAAYIFFPDIFPNKRYKPDTTLVKRIDSLEKANSVLQQQVSKYDSINSALETKVYQVDNKINDVKEKTIIIKEYYKEKTKEVNKFTPNQLDSFFKQRYNY